MRDIKFKVFCKKHNKEEIYTLGSLVCGETLSRNGEGGIFENWRQYTGLKDKNGKEIYEGDIYNQGDISITYTVVWVDTGLKGKQNHSLSYAGLEYWQDRIEVIGNIYDNPELLKGE